LKSQARALLLPRPSYRSFPDIDIGYDIRTEPLDMYKGFTWLSVFLQVILTFFSYVS